MSAGRMKPRLLDLFCGAGGAAVGYARAGFEVVGVDHVAQPNYPFEFVQKNALDYLYRGGASRFDAIHASPPCQFGTLLQAVAQNQDAHHDYIPELRELLNQTGLPWVMENVEGSSLQPSFRLCGSSFGLGLLELDRELRRHRYFETNWPIGLVPSCGHRKRAVGIHGDHLRLGRRSSDGEFSGKRALELGSEAMGIDWMTWGELKESVPPAMTELIGHQLMQHLEARTAA